MDLAELGRLMQLRDSILRDLAAAQKDARQRQAELIKADQQHKEVAYQKEPCITVTDPQSLTVYKDAATQLPAASQAVLNMAKGQNAALTTQKKIRKRVKLLQKAKWNWNLANEKVTTALSNLAVAQNRIVQFCKKYAEPSSHTIHHQPKRYLATNSSRSGMTLRPSSGSSHHGACRLPTRRSLSIDSVLSDTFSPIGGITMTADQASNHVYSHELLHNRSLPRSHPLFSITQPSFTPTPVEISIPAGEIISMAGGDVPNEGNTESEPVAIRFQQMQRESILLRHRRSYSHDAVALF